jgi:hypothetical protein
MTTDCSLQQTGVQDSNGLSTDAVHNMPEKNDAMSGSRMLLWSVQLLAEGQAEPCRRRPPPPPHIMAALTRVTPGKVSSCVLRYLPLECDQHKGCTRGGGRGGRWERNRRREPDRCADQTTCWRCWCRRYDIPDPSTLELCWQDHTPADFTSGQSPLTAPWASEWIWRLRKSNSDRTARSRLTTVEQKRRKNNKSFKGGSSFPGLFHLQMKLMTVFHIRYLNC